MLPRVAPDNVELIRSLRESAYNATVVAIRQVHDALLVMRVQPDSGRMAYEPGQYTVLGLGYWEPRLKGTQEERLTEKQFSTLAKRAYSISSPVLDESGRLASPGPTLEFYISLVRQAPMRPPALTPRLFLLQVGARLFLGPHVHGRYTLAGVKPDQDVVFAATGTGEAPHNSMLTELLARRHRGNIASVVCVRFREDLGYLNEHRELEKRFTNYRYIPLTTREPENVDRTHPHYIGKQYVQEFFGSAAFASRTQIPLDTERTHVFLCGNPDMIGAPHHPHDSVRRFPVSQGMVELLENRGFVVDLPHQSGHVHFENYW